MVLLFENGLKRFDRQLLKYISTGENEKALDMLKNIDPSNLFDSLGRSLLHWSTVELGNPVIIEYLIGKGCNVDARDEDGNTPLWSAVDADQGSIKALIEAGANIHIPNEKGESPVQFVLREWILPGRGVVKLFLNKLRQECGDDKQLLAEKLIDLKCPVYFAVLLRDAEITRIMLDRGCSVGARCHRVHDTALHEAVAQSDLANVKLLVERGADVNDVGYQDETPLYRYDVWKSDYEEKLEVLKFLLAQGASLDFTKGINSPMERIMSLSNKETIRALLQFSGIDLRKKYYSNNTALHFFCQNDRQDLGDVIRHFRGKDFDINAVNNFGKTALMTAVTRVLVSTVEQLLELGADPNIEDTHGRTAMFHLYKYFQEWCMEPREYFKKIVDLLLLYGADAQHHSGDGTFLEQLQQKRESYLAESIIARLAQMENHDRSAISNYTQRTIESTRKHQKYFGLCEKSLEKMKSMTVYESITLFELLNETNQRKLVKYVRNEEFVAAYNRIVSEKLDSIPHYYSFVIQRRITAAITMTNLKRQAASVFCKIIDLNEGHIISEEIVDYLAAEDLKNLIEAS